MPELNAKLFGTPAVSVDGREITLPYKKADALLYYLILKRKTTRSELIGLLYEDTDSATALKKSTPRDLHHPQGVCLRSLRPRPALDR